MRAGHDVRCVVTRREAVWQEHHVFVFFSGWLSIDCFISGLEGMELTGTASATEFDFVSSSLQTRSLDQKQWTTQCRDLTPTPCEWLT